ncbi:MAG: hypothetical protein IH626_17830 [Rhodospirillales bacterium]|nr:hypothetical protein [Rhodospirillales bacterium]
METKASAGGIGFLEPDDNWLVSRLPERVAGSLTAEQRRALHDAATAPAPGRPPVNLRFSVGPARWRMYVAVMAGIERRNAERLATERTRHPLHTLGNIFFALGLAVLFLLAALLAIALQSAILEF